MIQKDRPGGHAFSPAGVVGLLLAGLVCGVFWREIAHAVLRLT